MTTTEPHIDRSLLRPPRWTKQGLRRRAVGLIVLLAALVATGTHAQSLTLIAPGAFACPSAALPLRIATFQFRDGAPADPLAWVRVDEFRTAHAALALGPGHASVHVVVVAYAAGSPTDVEVSITPFGETQPTFRHTYRPSVPSVMRGGVTLVHDYHAIELAGAAARRAFPTEGPYVLAARTLRSEPDPYVDGFCDAETTSWVFVARR